MNKISVEIKYSNVEDQDVAKIVRTMDPSVEHLIRSLEFTAETKKEVTTFYVDQVKENLKKGFEEREGWIVHEVNVTI